MYLGYLPRTDGFFTAILKIFKSFNHMACTFLVIRSMCCEPGGQDLAHAPSWGSVKNPYDKSFCFLLLTNALMLL